MSATDAGQRGKKAEKVVDTLFRKWNGMADFSYFRLPDSRSARNFLQAQPGDFVYFKAPNAGIIEVKETQHAFRIAKDKLSQLANLKKLDLAGAQSVILIHHSTENCWRAIRPADLDIGPASWDLREHPCFSNAEGALRSMGYFS